MSLDVTILYKEPKEVDYNSIHAACGSTMRLVEDDSPTMESVWSANITHNMGKMAMNTPITVEIDGELYDSTLYQYIWRPYELGEFTCNTDIMQKALVSGITYMVQHRKELEQYNPPINEYEELWSDYDSFRHWLLRYENACVHNPDCLIEVSR